MMVDLARAGAGELLCAVGPDTWLQLEDTA